MTRRTCLRMKTHRRRGLKRSGNSSGRRKTVTYNSLSCLIKAFSVSSQTSTSVDAVQLVPFSVLSQIKSQRENSFRVWWTTRTSCDWYNMMSLRKLKTSWKRRSNKKRQKKPPLMWFKTVSFFFLHSYMIWPLVFLFIYGLIFIFHIYIMIFAFDPRKQKVRNSWNGNLSCGFDTLCSYTVDLY